MTKYCPHCKSDKDMSEFAKNRSSRDGLQSYCKVCRNRIARDNKSHNSKARKQYYINNADKLKAYKKEWYKNNRQRIRAEFTEAYWNDPDTFRSRSRQSYLKHRAHVLDYQRRYSQENRERVLQYHKTYSARNKDKLNTYFKKRYGDNANFRIMVNLRSRIGAALRGKRKSARTVDLIGCSLEQFRDHLESLFCGGMSWENYGSYWHIDHIIPCAAFDLSNESDQRKCFHWTNMQPLMPRENNAKNDFLPDGTRARHKMNVRQ